MTAVLKPPQSGIVGVLVCGAETEFMKKYGQTISTDGAVIFPVMLHGPEKDLSLGCVPCRLTCFSAAAAALVTRDYPPLRLSALITFP